MLLKQLEYFVSIVELNSFTDAAEANYISQSAISQQIQSLEKELGVSLLIRKHRTFHLSTAGNFFYRTAMELLSDLNNLKEETIRLGQDRDLSLKIGYLKCYNGLELHQSIEKFSGLYPEVEIDITNGTHEELYHMLRFGRVDVVLNDQRRAFSDEYVNCELIECDCFVELSSRNPLSQYDMLDLEQLKRMPCILIASKEQETQEADFYQTTLGFSGNFLFADSLEEGRLMVAAGRGYLPIDGVGTISSTSTTIKRLPLYRGAVKLKRKYCTFWNAYLAQKSKE